MTTHSQLVDDMVRETKRPDLLADISDYLNQTIRELHFTPDRGNAITYRDNLREIQLTANAEEGYSWTIPNPHLFQQMVAVRYDSLFSRDAMYTYADERVPGRAMNNSLEYYYRAGNLVFFSGYGGLNSVISLAYYEYPRRLKYYPAGSRPVEWGDELMSWTYDPAFDTDDEMRLDARNLCSNWVLLRWRDVVAEGLKAKVYKRLSDDGRARTSYSLYSQMRQGLFTSEVAVPGRV
jgi:hypothetical protein